MRKILTKTITAFTLLLGASALAAPPGTGPTPSVMEVDPSLPSHTVYRPKDLGSLPKAALPIVVFGNGGCFDDGGAFRELLGEVASHGFIAIATGTPKVWPIPIPPNMPAAGERRAMPANLPPPATKAVDLITAIDWAIAENSRPGSALFGRIDPGRIAVMGQSCGGLQALEVSADPRISTTVVLNSGIFNPGFPGMRGVTVTKDSLKKLHAPIVYLLGGPSDIAYANGMDDFSRIDGVPVLVGNMNVGHGGTHWQKDGGRFAQVVTLWLQWRLKADAEAAKWFTGPGCKLCADPEWTVDRKGME